MGEFKRPRGKVWSDYGWVDGKHPEDHWLVRTIAWTFVIMFCVAVFLGGLKIIQLLWGVL